MIREAAKEILTHNWTRVDNPNYSESELDEAYDMAIEALSAEAVQVEWTNEDGKPITDKFSVYCSRCKRWSEYRTNYCGHCGADMRGSRE